MNDLPTLQQRVGNRYWGGSDAMARAGVAPVPGAASPAPTAFWGRIEGGHADLQPSSTTGSTYKADQMKVQTGLDGLALENERGRLIVGLTAQYGLTTANVASVFGNGRIRAEGTGVGGTLTWYGDNGFYVDGQAQSMFYRSDLSSVLAGSMTHGNEGFGYAFSAETGKRFGVGNGWSLTPQAQLVLFEGRFRQLRRSVRRAGVARATATACSAAPGLRSTIRGPGTTARASCAPTSTASPICATSSSNGTNVDVAGTGFANAQDRLWGSIGGGGTYSWANGRYAVFGEVSYNASLERRGGEPQLQGHWRLPHRLVTSSSLCGLHAPDLGGSRSPTSGIGASIPISCSAIAKPVLTCAGSPQKTTPVASAAGLSRDRLRIDRFVVSAWECKICVLVRPREASPQVSTLGDRHQSRRRNDQRHAGEENQYQHRLAKHFVVDRSVEFEADPYADDHERKPDAVQFEGFNRVRPCDELRDRDDHKCRKQHRLKHRALLVP